MYDAKVQNEAKSRTDARGRERRYAPLDESNVHTRSVCAFAGHAHRLRHDVDAGYLPPALSQVNRPVPGAASEIERAPMGRLSAALLSGEECNGLVAYRE